MIHAHALCNTCLTSKRYLCYISKMLMACHIKENETKFKIACFQLYIVSI